MKETVDGRANDKLENKVRVKKGLEMRLNGFSYEEIADALGWNSRQAAFKSIHKYIDQAIATDATELKNLSLMRLESVIASVLAKAQKGNLLAVDRLIKLTKREGEILGFDEQTKNDLTLGFEIVVKNESDRKLDQGEPGALRSREPLELETDLDN